MKTTLSKLCVCVILLLVVSCARKASMYTDIFSTRITNESFKSDVIEENNVVSNKQLINFNNNFGSFTSYRPTSIGNSIGSSAAASASVTVIDPASLSQSEDLVFGKISLKNLKNKFVNLNDIGASNQRILVPNTYTNSALNSAEFKINGGNNKAFDISVPNQILLYHQNGNDVLSALINATKSSKKSGDLTNFKFAIDGRVYFNSLSTPGVYSSKDFAVTVNYN